MKRPQITVILAMTADGKISDYRRSRFNLASAVDKAHLEERITESDGVLFGAGTLRAYGTTLRVSNPEYLKKRERLGKVAQPVQIVCSNSGDFALDLPFFSQPVPRWLLTGNAELKIWQKEFPDAFDKILVNSKKESFLNPDPTAPKLDETEKLELDWEKTLAEFWNLGIHKLAVLGGGDLVGSLLTENVIDELWLTICPYLVGGKNAPTAIAGAGLLLAAAEALTLKEVRTVGQEIFLHYLCQ